MSLPLSVLPYMSHQVTCKEGINILERELSCSHLSAVVFGEGKHCQ